ncbi:aldehyde dehydrogenase [Roseomonas sp. SSH11]|uniref:Aldehyde dehydrogenase n=1 Tax=Pararoseomonas baculiformis TaxID=2820812 RepID=A0ABS4AJB4_9PROT|nr:thiamine pyrophosphate-dependent enzyme [Pararoseomonas baculiformis]MBP0446944.1 aldehyde dehydrogenase [Pararoseomonas baculiformis]
MSGTLDRRAAVAALLRERGEAVVISGLGSPTYDVAAAGDDDLNFPLWGAMGGAAVMGLGLALAQPERPVLVVTGDGEMLMGMGSLATIAAQAPGNLVIAVLDNGLYGETGGQRSHTAMGTDLAAVARGCGIADVRVIETMEGIEALARRVPEPGATGPCFAVLRIAGAEPERVLPPRDAAALLGRTRKALGLSPGI